MSAVRLEPSGDEVTLQVSLAPSDWRIAGDLLPHQIRAWADQVSEILITIETRKSTGRFGDDWDEGREKVHAVARRFKQTRIVDVDYSEKAKREVSEAFFAGNAVPDKDWRGGPYYSYFFALQAARNDLILHADADMFYGGPSKTWIAEATQVLRSQPEIIFVSPLPGPPDPQGGFQQLKAQAETRAGFSGYTFDSFSTRTFFCSRQKLRKTVFPLQPRRPAFRKCLLAVVDGNPMQALPEDLISEEMRKKALKRFDFAGKSEIDGRWSLHPPYRTEDFYRKLSGLVVRIESGDLPRAQLGDHDINGSLVDWGEAIERLRSRRWWRRLFGRFGISTPAQRKKRAE